MDDVALQPTVASVETVVQAQRESWPHILTVDEAIRYLRLETYGDPHEALRTLTRRQGLPVISRGRYRRFRKASLDQWLADAEGGKKAAHKMVDLARLARAQANIKHARDARKRRAKDQSI